MGKNTCLPLLDLVPWLSLYEPEARERERASEWYWNSFAWASSDWQSLTTVKASGNKEVAIVEGDQITTSDQKYKADAQPRKRAIPF